MFLLKAQPRFLSYLLMKRKYNSLGDASKKMKTDNQNKNFEHKFISWNVNGIRALWNKESGNYLLNLVSEETKLQAELESNFSNILTGYTAYFNSCTSKKGYSGTAVYISNKVQPISVSKGIGIEKHDIEGRSITVELQECYLIITYVPNSGKNFERLDYRSKEWDVDMKKYILGLQEKKPVVWAGDFNIALEDIDAHKQKANQNTDQEKILLQELMNKNHFIDAFRYLYPTKPNCFTYWGYIGNMRNKDKGWRVDHFFVSEHLKDKVHDCFILKDHMGSDHCPIGLVLK
ncbi:exodeoxyribonuclease [Acrasis kona]|uniref:Exodeoxyribonuclease n=1 Tax=Acrasis kona TaxID=1008807 RepID=A0AAW2YSE9_9EUKA